MATSNYIQNIVDAQKGKPRSVQWFKDKIRELGQPGTMDLIRDGKRSNKPFYGRLNMFTYNPKHKKKLPYYDTFPLVLPIEKYPDGFLGINFHYLPIPLRIRLLDKLVPYASNNRFDDSTIVKVNYDALKKVNLIKPTLHRYLAGYTVSQFRRIDADEFTVATLLPVQRFKKASEKQVYADSRRML